MSAPILVQMNPDGKWENAKPCNLEEERLRAIVQHLVRSKALGAAQSYCCQCANDSQRDGGGTSNYIPVIMMPIYPADECPFDVQCEIERMREAEDKPKKKDMTAEKEMKLDTDKEKKKLKKRGFVMQRLTDFDLLSQW